MPEIEVSKEYINKIATNLINNKIEEHKLEITGCGKALIQIQTEIKNKTERPDMMKIKQLGILKDKMLFHRAALATLADLLEDLQRK